MNITRLRILDGRAWVLAVASFIMCMGAKLHAQTTTSVAVTISATANGSSPWCKVTDGNGNTVAELTSTGSETFNLMMQLDAPYIVNFRVRDLSDYRVRVAAPGYGFIVDGIARSSELFPGVTNETTTGAKITLVKKAARTRGGTQPVGESSQIAWGGGPTDDGPWSWPYLTFNLGSGLDGEDLRPLHVPLIKRDATSRSSASYYHTSDVIPSDGAGVVVLSAPDANGSFVVEAPQARVSYTVDPNTGASTIAFARPGTTTTFVSYTIEFPTWTWLAPGGWATSTPANKVKVTKTVTGGNAYETVFEGSYGCRGIMLQTTRQNTWSIEQWHKQGESVVSTLFGQRTHKANPNWYGTSDGTYSLSSWWYDDFQVKSGSASNPGTVVSKTQHEYSYYVFNDGGYSHGKTFLTKITDGDTYVTKSLVNPYDAGPEVWGAVQQSVSGTVFPTGNTHLELVDLNSVKTIYETWLDTSPTYTLVGALEGNPCQPVLNSTGSAITTCTPVAPYGATVWSDFDWYASVERKLGAITLSKTTMTYAAEAWGSAEKLVLITSNGYKDASTVGLTTTIRQFRPDTPDSMLRGRPYSMVSPDGTKTSYAYEHLAGTGFRISILSGLATGGTAVTALGSVTIDPIGLVANRSTKTVETYSMARLMTRATYVYTGGGGSAPIFDESRPIASESFTYTDDGRLNSRTALNGSSYTATWVGTRKTEERDETGLVTTFSYDSADRMQAATRAAVTASNFSVPAQVTNYEYDAANRMTATRVGSAGSSQLSTIVSYDLGGRVSSRTVPGGLADAAHPTPAGITTTYTYLNGGRSVTETTPQGNKTTAKYVDGKLSSITGTMVVPEYHKYAFDAGNQLMHTTNLGTATGRSRIVTTDLLGRMKTDEAKSFPVDTAGNRKAIVTTSNFNDQGLIESSVVKYDPSGVNLSLSADKLFEYDAFGQLSASGLNLDGAAHLGDAGTDRFSTSAVDYYLDGNSAWWSRSVARTYTTDNRSDTVATTTYARLTGFPAGVLSQTDTVDAYGNRTSVSNSFATASKSHSESILLADGTTRVRTTVGGLVVSEQVFADNGTNVLQTTSTYDALGRLTAQTDSRGLVSSRDYYTGTEQVNHVYGRNAANNGNDTLSTITYDLAGRVASRTAANNAVSSFSYYATGLMQDETGTGAYPVHHVYNVYGEQTELWTYRDGTTPDKTIWDYDNETGLLKSKTDAAGRSVQYSYSYSALYKIVTRRWARGVTTTWKYLLTTGDLARVEYSDGTQTVTYNYTRSGKVDSVSDATGSRDLVYDHEQLSAEGLDATWYQGLVLTQLYDNTSSADRANNLVPGRYAGYELGVTGDLARELKESIGYDDFGRVAGASAIYAARASRAGLSVAGSYSYQANTSFWTAFAQGNFTQARSFETGRNVISSTSASWGTSVVAQHAYTTNAALERTAIAQQGTAFDGGYGEATFARFTYNSRGELTDAEGYLGNNTNSLTRPMSGRGLHFTYDTAGNRKTAAVDSEQVTYTDGQGTAGGNNLNQVKVRGTLKTHVSGTADASASVAVDGAAITRDGVTRYWDSVLASAQQYRKVAIAATLSGQSQSQEAWALFRPTTETLTYDEDGNLTGDGVWSYTWNAENQLVQMTNLPAQSWGMPSRTITFLYDYLGRRVRKTSNDGAVTTDRKYVYQGWNLIAELDASCNVLRSFAWGLDVQGSLTASGGVGALVLETVHTSTSLTAYHVANDANGNVVALIAAGPANGGSLAAVYEYDAFGQLLRRTGAEAASNPFRFSTKFCDQETGLYYYGYRYYDANLGRFINRDPIAEAGGRNLYAFVANNAINRWDYLGQWWGEGAWQRFKNWFSHVGSEDGEEIVKLDEFEVRADRSAADEEAQQDQEGGASNSEITAFDRFVTFSKGYRAIILAMGDSEMQRYYELGVEDAIRSSGYSEADMAELRRVASLGKAAGGGAVILAYIASFGGAALLAPQVRGAPPQRVISPNEQMRANANASGTYRDPLTGNIVPARGRLPADHIVSQNEIKAMPGYETLTAAQQDAILNQPLNTQGLPKTFNSSKGAKFAEDWLFYKGIPLDPIYVTDQVAQAQLLRPMIQQQINDFNAANAATIKR